MINYYNQDQLLAIVPHLKKPPQWLILAGPADGNEAQCARSIWPEVKVLGLEPNPEAREWQLYEGGWPTHCLLLPDALGASPGKGQLWVPSGHLQSASLEEVRYHGAPPEQMHEVNVTILDVLDREHGPFTDAILWLDIEGSELDALRGGPQLLARKDGVMLVTVEMLPRRPEQNKAIDELLTGHRFKLVRWWTGVDAIYVKD